tara:strand:+ start:82 stop:234 length:153 start_codon:yes stop_codon:yes gene_type:complete
MHIQLIGVVLVCMHIQPEGLVPTALSQRAGREDVRRFGKMWEDVRSCEKM